MKRILAFLTFLVLLSACAPQESVPEVTPAVQPAPVVEPQMPPEQKIEPVSEPMSKQIPVSTAHDVMIKSFRHNPSTITIKAGDAVRWTNDDSASHDATGTDWGTKTPLRKGESAEVTFDKPGTYEYICSIHPYMKGKVVVE